MEYNPYDEWRRIAPDERARQFMPFAALRGYYGLIREAEYTPEPRRPHTEEHSRALSEAAARIRNRDLVCAVYYNGNAYVSITGVVSQISCELRTIRIVKTTIPFKDLWELELLSAKNMQRQTLAK